MSVTFKPSKLKRSTQSCSKINRLMESKFYISSRTYRTYLITIGPKIVARVVLRTCVIGRALTLSILTAADPV